MKILIAIPTYENITPDTFKAVYDMHKGFHKVDFHFFRGYDVANARNQIAQVTLQKGYDYVLMVDNDTTPPPFALLNLIQTDLEEPERGVVVGYQLSRPTATANKSGRTTTYKFGDGDFLPEEAYTEDEIKAILDSGLTRVQVRGSGLGCALIHRSIFEKMSYPYFRWITYDNEAQLSEDLYFCEQVNGIERTILCDTRVRCGHMMRFIA